jgi:radical SAM superfamily enzyme YgiQ (UPF0313 family)
MKVVLVRTPFIELRSGLPLGLTYLQKELKDAGHNVVVYDFNIDVFRAQPFSCGQFSRNFTLPTEHMAYSYVLTQLNKYRDKILAEKPDVVGFHLTYSTRDISIKLAKLLRKHNIRLIAGGPDTIHNAQKLIDKKVFDTVVCGYGEESICDALTTDGILERPLNKDKDYRPDFSGVDFKNYGGQFPILTTRGCPRSCTFCSQRLHYIQHSIESVKEQIEQSPPDCTIILNDSNLNINTKRTKNLLQEISTVIGNRKIHAFGFEVDKKFGEYLDEFSKCNFSCVRIGIESGSLSLRDEIRKHKFTNNDAINMVHKIAEAGTDVWVQYIFCYPGETDKDREETVKLMHRMYSEKYKGRIRQLWYRFIVHHGTEQHFREKYDIKIPTIRDWHTKAYNPKIVQNLANVWKKKLPKKTDIFL